MDGVIYRGGTLVPGAQDFVAGLLETKTPFLFLTNNSEQTPLDLKNKLLSLGIHGIREDNFITSAMATAEFLASQKPNGTAYVIGGGGLINELYNAGYSITEHKPDYVVVGRTVNFNYQMLLKAAKFIQDGAKFIGTNPDLTDRAPDGTLEPACGSILAAIEKATGKTPYIVGKPNAVMMMFARKKLNARSSETIMIGDRMDTDIVGGIEAGMRTCLVLSGVSTRETIAEFPYQPTYIFNTVGEIDIQSL
jgi:NagD protein